MAAIVDVQRLHTLVTWRRIILRVRPESGTSYYGDAMIARDSRGTKQGKDGGWLDMAKDIAIVIGCRQDA